MIEEKDGLIATNWQVSYALADDFDSDGNITLFPPVSFSKKHNIIKNWLLNYESQGRFYVCSVFGLVYIERDEDRMMFELKWRR